MDLRSILIALLAAAVVLAVCFDECSGQGRRPQQPKPDAPKGPERNIPGWTEVSGSIPDDKAEARKATVFEHFSGATECKMDKPFVIYFYWPDEGKMERTAVACSKFEKSLAAASNLQSALGNFGCYKCSAKDLDKKLKSKYSAKPPTIVVFDATGKKVYSITKISKSDKTVAKKMESIKKASDKAVEKAKAKEEKEGK
jgi:hypothetical protein